MTTRAFTLHDVLSVTTGVLLHPEKDRTGACELVKFVTGRTPNADNRHDLAVAAALIILAQRPELQDVTAPSMDPYHEEIQAWLPAQYARYGPTIEVEPDPDAIDWTHSARR